MRSFVMAFTASLVGIAMAGATPANADPRFEEAIIAVEKWDTDEAIALLKSACEDDVATACTRLLGLYAEKNKKDESRALAGSECDQGDSRACYLLARLARFGEGGPKDRELQRASYKKACDLKLLAACPKYADLAERALGGPEDFSAALAAVRFACAQGNSWSCTYAGDLLTQSSWKQDDPALAEAQIIEAHSFYKEACQNYDAEGCMRYADVLMKGEGGEKDPVKALKILEKSCDQEERACDRALELRFYQP